MNRTSNNRRRRRAIARRASREAIFRVGMRGWVFLHSEVTLDELRGNPGRVIATDELIRGEIGYCDSDFRIVSSGTT